MGSHVKPAIILLAISVAVHALPSRNLEIDMIHELDGADYREGYGENQLKRNERDTNQDYEVCVVTGNGWTSGTSDQLFIRLGTRRTQWSGFVALPKANLAADSTVCSVISGQTLNSDVTDIELVKDGSDDWFPVEIRVRVVGERGYVPCSWADKCGGRHYTCQFSDNRVLERIPCGDYTTG